MHVIGKYIVHLRTNGGDGLSLQRELQESFEQKLIPKIERLFDQIAIDDRPISIDRLELDINITPDEEWFEIMSDQILQKLEDEIQLHKRFEESVVSNNQANSHHSLKPGVLKSRPMLAIEKFTFFLVHGYLPWWCTNEELTVEEDELVKIFQSTQHSKNESDLIAQQVKTALYDEKARERLLQQFTHVLFRHLIEFLFPNEHASMNTTIDDYTNFYAGEKRSDIYKKQPPHEFKKQVLTVALGRSTLRSWKDFQPGDNNFSMDPNVKRSPVNKVDKDTIIRKEENEAALKNDQTKVLPDHSKKDLISDLFNLHDKETVEEIFIDNAGLIIVAPFLLRLFQQLGWIVEMKVHPAIRAVHLLHYLATGSHEGREYDFVLNKILCGLEVEEPLERIGELTKEEMEAADKVLIAVIEHWKIIKNTSMEGLRESFLMRNGKLSKKGDDWLLQVEQKSYDMLLDSLPWSISLIRLPFMQATLHVEWK